MNTQLNKNERGVAHLGLIVLAVVVIAAIAFAGWRVAGSSKPATKHSTTTTAAQSSKAGTDSTCIATYHDANLCHFAANANMDKLAYAATLTNTDTDGVASTMAFASDGKGNTTLTAQGDGQELNSIQLNGVLYTKMAGSDTWIQYPAGSAAQDDTDPASNMNLVLGAGITYKPLGKEACGKLTCFKYQVSEAATPDVTQFAWFDTKDYKLREWKYTDPTAGTTQMSLTYQAVSIKKPSPVQQLSTGVGQ